MQSWSPHIIDCMSLVLFRPVSKSHNWDMRRTNQILSYEQLKCSFPHDVKTISTRMIPRRPGLGDRKYSRSQAAGKVPEFTGTFFEKVEKGQEEKRRFCFFKVVWVVSERGSSPGRSLWRRQRRLRSTRTRCWEDTAHPPVTTPGRPAAKQDNMSVLHVRYWRKTQIRLFTTTANTQLDL